MNIIFIDDSKGYMEKLLCKSQMNDNKILFMELIENNMTPITIFFGNYENEYRTYKPIGEQELQEFLDNYANKLSCNGYEYDDNHPTKCIYKKDKFEVNVNESAFLLYDNNDLTAQKILQRWDDEIEPKLKYNAERYDSDEINNLLDKLDNKISKNSDNIVLIDMLLVINDDIRFVDKQDIRNIPDKPILSMIIYHYLHTKSVKCAVYSTFAEREIFKEKWIPMYNKFFTDNPLNENDKDFIFDRDSLNLEKIKNI